MKDFGRTCRDVRTREVGIQEVHHKLVLLLINLLEDIIMLMVGGKRSCLMKILEEKIFQFVYSRLCIAF